MARFGSTLNKSRWHKGSVIRTAAAILRSCSEGNRTLFGLGKCEEIRLLTGWKRRSRNTDSDVSLSKRKFACERLMKEKEEL